MSSEGEVVRGRCKATNLCEYCARIAAVETTEMLWIDALGNGSPGLWLLLTTTDAVWDGERWRRSLAQVTRAAKLRWPAFEYACLIEFTTGYGPRSGGKRRPHANVFVRGVPVEDADELQAVVASVWVPRMIEGWNRSERYAAKAFEQQRVSRVAEDKGGMRGLTRYVGMHFLKESQAPPKGWRGQRFRASRGYFSETRAVVRERARLSLQHGRRVWRAERQAFDRVEEEVLKARYEPDSPNAARFRGFLVAEGYFEEWLNEALAALEERAAVPLLWELFQDVGGGRFAPVVPARARRRPEP